jgi:two-component system cell cycle response regulator
VTVPEVLLVEDDHSMVRLLQHHLRRGGYNVRVAGSLAEARRHLADPFLSDLILLDRQLPDGDGVTLCQEVRSRNPHAYILMLTAQSSSAAKLEGFGCGADDYVTKPFQAEELLARIRAGLRIVALQKALLDSNRKLQELSNTDALTGLRNRRFFEQVFPTMFEQARRYWRPLSLAMVDIDHFKAVNDAYGHAAGDTVLKKVAGSIAACTRKSDVVARIGGEEFAIVLPETPLFESLKVAEKIRANVAALETKFEGVTIRAHCSIGVANVPSSRFARQELMVAAADNALYEAKRNGRNRVEMKGRRKSASGTIGDDDPTE